MPIIPAVRPQPNHLPSSRSRPVSTSTLPESAVAAAAVGETGIGQESEEGFGCPRVTEGFRDMEVGRAGLGAGTAGSVEAERLDGGLEDAEPQEK